MLPASSAQSGSASAGPRTWSWLGVQPEAPAALLLRLWPEPRRRRAATTQTSLTVAVAAGRDCAPSWQSICPPLRGPRGWVPLKSLSDSLLPFSSYRPRRSLPCTTCESGWLCRSRPAAVGSESDELTLAAFQPVSERQHVGPVQIVADVSPQPADVQEAMHSPEGSDPASPSPGRLL